MAAMLLLSNPRFDYRIFRGNPNFREESYFVVSAWREEE